jgi:hypothetical protein
MLKTAGVAPHATVLDLGRWLRCRERDEQRQRARLDPVGGCWKSKTRYNQRDH